MAIVKFINSKCPMNNIFPYVARGSATEEKLIDGVNCSAESAREEFEYVKNKFGKTDGRMYYHIVQSFSPDDKITPEGIKCRDTKLFDERLLKDNLEVYFALGGADTKLSKIYNDYETPEHHPNATMTSTAGLFSLLTDLLTVAPPRQDYSPDMVNEMSPFEKARLERILGKRISPKAVAHYSTQEEYEQAMGLSW